MIRFLLALALFFVATVIDVALPVVIVVCVPTIACAPPDAVTIEVADQPAPLWPDDCRFPRWPGYEGKLRTTLVPFETGYVLVGRCIRARERWHDPIDAPPSYYDHQPRPWVSNDFGGDFDPHDCENLYPDDEMPGSVICAMRDTSVRWMPGQGPERLHLRPHDCVRAVVVHATGAWDSPRPEPVWALVIPELVDGGDGLPGVRNHLRRAQDDKDDEGFEVAAEVTAALRKFRHSVNTTGAGRVGGGRP